MSLSLQRSWREYTLQTNGIELPPRSRRNCHTGELLLQFCKLGCAPASLDGFAAWPLRTTTSRRVEDWSCANSRACYLGMC